jgi:hypothetical protein
MLVKIITLFLLISHSPFSFGLNILENDKLRTQSELRYLLDFYFFIFSLFFLIERRRGRLNDEC